MSNKSFLPTTMPVLPGHPRPTVQPLHSALIASREGELTFGLFQSPKRAALVLVYPALSARSNFLIKQASPRNKSH